MRAINKVLIIDDESSIRSMLRFFLERKQYFVLEAENGEVGIKIFEKDSPDLVITDIKMPLKNGIEVLKYINKKNTGVEVIILTGHGDMELVMEAIKLRAADFLTKPFNIEQLSRSIDRVETRAEARKKILKLQSDIEKRVSDAIFEIQESYEFENALINNTLNAVICFDNNKNVMMFNKWAEHITGYSEKEINTVGLFELFSKKTRSKIQHTLFDKKENLEWLETKLKSKTDDTIPIKISGTVLYKRDGETLLGTVVFLHDLRDIKKLEEDLDQASRFAGVGETVAGLAHCIKNILIGLEGALYVVNKGIKKESFEKINKGWLMIENNIGRISDLSLQLLSFSKKRVPEYSICNPGMIIDDIYNLLEEKAKKNNVKIIKDIQENITTHLLDKNAIHRSILNLVVNSIEAFNEKKDGTREIKITAKHNSNSWLNIEIKDNGCGISENVKKKLFDSVYSSKGSRGTGLGLLTTNKIIKEHGGTLELDSKLNHGTTFTIKIPPKEEE